MVTATRSNTRSVKFGIVIPTEWECTSLLNQLEEAGLETNYYVSDLNDPDPWLVRLAYLGPDLDNEVAAIITSYVGRDNAAAATEFLIQNFRPEIILHAGAAGAVAPDMMPGDIVIGSAVRSVASKVVMRSRKSLALPSGLDRFYKNGVPEHHDQLLADWALVRDAASIADELVLKWGVWTAPGWPTSRNKKKP